MGSLVSADHSKETDFPPPSQEKGSYFTERKRTSEKGRVKVNLHVEEKVEKTLSNKENVYKYQMCKFAHLHSSLHSSLSLVTGPGPGERACLWVTGTITWAARAPNMLLTEPDK